MAQKNSKKKNNLNNLIKKNQDIFGLKKAWLQGKAALTSPANPLPERGLLFEALEPRVLMSADLSYGTATDLTLTFDSLATTYNLVDQAANIISSAAQTDDGLVNITGTAGNDFLTLDLTNFSTPVSINFLGGGSDTLAGDAVDTTWDITGQNAGKVNTNIDFTGFENLVGGSDSDLFNFADGATITGTVDGGAGSNSLDYTEYKTAITVDLGNHTATGTGGATHFDDLTGGSATSDTLIGTAQASTWDITGDNSGTINGTAFAFSGFENLTGAASTNDSFILEDAGSLSGVLDGGAGGLDSLLVGESTANTNYALVNAADSNAASVTLFTKTVNYTGLEPIVSGTANDKIVLGSSLNDQFLLESVDSTNLRITSSGADIYDAATNMSVSSLVIASPTATLTFSLGTGNDQLTLGILNLGFAQRVIYKGGTGDNILFGGDTDNTWNLEGVDAGTLNSNISFTNVKSFIGGTGDDDFIFADGALVDGVVDGGAGGLNTLDYSHYLTAQTIALNVGNLNINNVIGGAASDTLVGTAADNTWNITSNNAGTLASSVTNRMVLDSSTVVDPQAGKLKFAYVHLFSTGDIVTYTSAAGNDGSGLRSDNNYYVLVVDANTLKLTDTAAVEATLNSSDWTSGTRSLTATGLPSLAFDGTEVIDGFANTITFANNHGLTDGEQLTYASGDSANDNSQLVSGTTYSVLVVDATTIKLLMSAPTVVALSASTNWSTASRSLTNVQNLDSVSFSGIENLTGNAVKDNFVFAINAGVAGAIDGGAGVNSLDYSAYTDSVSVNLGSNGVMTGASSVSHITQVIGGSGNTDTLQGPDQNATWDITGANSGTVNGISFSGFENLTGATHNQDGFIVHGGGSISGVINGGSNGQDNLALEDPNHPGNLTVIIPGSTGSGTLSANALYQGVGSVSFTGMERPFYADSSVAGQVTLHGSAFNDTLVLSQQGSNLRLTETSVSRSFWDVATTAFVDNSFDFVVAAVGTIKTDLGTNDQFSMGAYDSASLVNLDFTNDSNSTSSVTVSDSTIVFAGNVSTHGGYIKVNGVDNITVNAGVTLSTRVTDIASGHSIAGSGDITLNAKTITVNNGAQLLSYDDRKIPDPAGVPAAITVPTYPDVKIDGFGGGTVPLWRPGYVYNNKATLTNGAGTGLTVDIVVDKAGTPQILLHDHGTGYRNNDAIWITLGGLGADQELTDSFSLLGIQLLDHTLDLNALIVGGKSTHVVEFNINGLLSKGGDIALLATNHEFLTGSFGLETTTATIDIYNAMLHGRNVAIRADADNHKSSEIITKPDGALGDFVSGLNTTLSVLSKYRPFVGVGILKAEASVTLHAGTHIIADADVTITARSNSAVLLDVSSELIGMGYAKSESNATVTIETEVSILANGSVQLVSYSNNTIDMSVDVGKGLFYGMIGGVKASPVEIAIAVTDATSLARTTVNAGVTIQALTGNVDILAITNKNLSTAARGEGEYSVLAGGVVWATSSATAETIVNGTVTATNAKVSILALASSIKNSADGSTQIGSTAGSRKIDAYGKAKFKNYLQNKTGVKKGLDGISNLRNELGVFLFMKGPIGSFSEKIGKLVIDDGNPAESFKSFGGTFSLSYADHTNIATAQIGGTAIIRALEAFTVKADVIDRPVIIAAAAVDNGTNADTKEQTPKKYAGAVAITVGKYTNTSTASILAGATVDSNGLEVVARTFIPYDFPLERVVGLGDALGKVYTVIAGRNNGATTSWAKGGTASDKVGVSGSVNILTLDSTAKALIDSGSKINQNHLYPLGDVTVHAETISEVVNLVDNPLKLIGLFKAANGSGGGGAYGGVNYTTITTAIIGVGALVNANNLSVDAKTDTYNVLLGITAGKGKGFAINGVATVVDVNDNTLAQISQGAVVNTTGTVEVTANDVLFNINGAGGISIGKSVGVGVTAATNNIIRNTHALIGNQEVVLGQGITAPNTGANTAANTIDLGYVHGFTTGDSVIYSNPADTAALGGLVDGGLYYVRVINPTTVQLARSQQEALQTAPTYGLASVNNNQITLAYATGFRTGDAVAYNNGGGTDLGGLVNGQIYYVITGSTGTSVKLALTAADAAAGDNVRLDTTHFPGSGNGHSLHLHLDTSGLSGNQHNLGRTFAPVTAVDNTNGNINLGYNHGFTTGQQVFYSNGGGDSIDGLANKTAYYVIVVDSKTIRLADSIQNALHGVSLTLDATQATGSLHAFGVAFNAIPLVDSTAHTLHFDGVQAYRDGQSVVYDNGGGASIGGLTQGATYYVKVIDAHTIQLATDSANLDNSVVNLDGSVATGTGHALRDPGYGILAQSLGGTALATVSSGGLTTVSATNTGHIYTVTVAAAGTSGPDSKAAPNSKEAQAGAKFGVAVSGSVSVNVINDTAEAFVRGVVLSNLAGLDVEATNTTHNVAVSGSAALSLNKKGSLGLAGAVTVNLVNSTTHAFIENSSLTNVGAVTVNATATGTTLAIAAGFGGSPNGVGVAGSVAINTMNTDTQAYFNNSSIVDSTSLSVTASDTTSIIAVGGAIAFGGKAGIGAGFAYNYITGGALASLSNSSVILSGALRVTATNSSQITAVAAAIAASYSNKSVDNLGGHGDAAGTKSFSLALAAGVSINTVSATTKAYISGGSVTAGSVTVLATDINSQIIGIGGGLAIGVSISGRGAGSSTSLAAGASFVYNNLDHTIEAYVENATVNVTGDETITADSKGTVTALAIAGSVAGSMGNTKGSAFAGAGAGSVTLNRVRGGVKARMSKTNTTARNLTLLATDTSTITADAGGVAIAVALAKGKSSSTAASIGAAVAFNDIEEGYVEATIEDSMVITTNTVSLTATSNATITALTLAGAGAVAGGSGGGIAVSGAGAYSQNNIVNTVEAAITGSSVTAGDVTLSATDTSTVTANTYGASVAAGVSTGAGTGGSLSVGVSLAYNTVNTQVLAHIDSSTVTTTAGNIVLSATSTPSITALSVAASVAAATSSSGNAIAFSGGGAEAKNTILGKTNAYVTGSVLDSQAAVTLTATNTGIIDATVAAVSVSFAASTSKNAGSVSIGAARSRNFIGSEDGLTSLEVQAYVQNSSIKALGDLTQTATSKQTIIAKVGAASVSVAIGKNAVGLSGSGVETINKIKESVKAYIEGQGATGISAANITLTAKDASHITALAGAASLAAVGGTNAGVAVSIGVALADNEINNDVAAYISGASGNNSIPNGVVTTGNGSITLTASSKGDPAGDLNLSTPGLSVANLNDAAKADKDDALIDANADTRLLDKLSAAFKSQLDITLVDINTVSTPAKFRTSDSSQDVAQGDTVQLADGSVYRYLGGDSDGTASSIDLSSETQYTTNTSLWAKVSALKLTAVTEGSLWSLMAGDGTTYLLTLDAGNSNIIHVTRENINAVAAAASVAIGVGEKAGFALSGAGAEATNIILSKTNAYIENSSINSGNNVTLVANSSSGINAVVAAVSVSIAVGSNAGVGASIGAALAHNLIGWNADGNPASVEVQAYVKDSSIQATGQLSQTAFATQNIQSLVWAGSAAISGSVSGVALSLSGAGASAVNKISTQVRAYIDGALGTTVEAGNISLTANDISTINARVDAVAIAASFSVRDPAISIAIGVALAENSISNKVEAYIAHVPTVTSQGTINLVALEAANVTADTVAASIAIGISPSFFSVALTGAGANATNNINNYVHAYITDSTAVNATSGITVHAESASTISSVVGAIAVAAAVGGGGGVAGAIGVSLARNTITNEVLAYATGTSLTSTTGNIILFARAADRVDVVAYAGSVAIAGGAQGALSLAGAGVEVTNHLQTRTEAYINNANVTATIGNIQVQSVSDSQIIKAQAIGVAVAASLAPAGLAVSVAATVVDNDIKNTVNANISGSSFNVINAGGTIAITANAEHAKISDASAVTASVSAGLIGVSVGGVDIHNVIDNTIMAGIDGALTVTATGDVNIIANENAYLTAESENVAVSISVGAAIGVTVLKNEILSSIEAHLVNATVNSMNSSVAATSVANIEKTKAIVVTASVVAIGSNKAEAIVKTSVIAKVEAAHLTATGNVSVIADSHSTANAYGNGEAIGPVVGVGVVYTDATIEGTTRAGLGGVITAGSVTVQATGIADAKAETTAAAGGILAVGVNTAKSTTQQTVEAQIDDHSMITAIDNVEVLADAQVSGWAETFGLDIGAFGVGASFSTVTLAPTVHASIGDDARVTTDGQVTLSATLSHNKGDAKSNGSSGKLIGYTHVEAIEDVAVDVKALIGARTQITGINGITINSDAGTTDLDTNADGYIVAGISGQDAIATETVNTSAYTKVGAHAQLFSMGDVNISAVNKVDVTSSSYTLFVGLGAGSVATSTTTINGYGDNNTKLAETWLDEASTITARVLNVDATVDKLSVDSRANVSQFAFAGYVKTVSDVTVNSTTSVFLGQGAKASADSITITSRHDELNIYSLGSASGASLKMEHEGDVYDHITLQSNVTQEQDSELRANTLTIIAHGGDAADSVKQETHTLSLNLLGDWVPDTFKLQYDASAAIDIKGSLVSGVKNARLLVAADGSLERTDFVDAVINPNTGEVILNGLDTTSSGLISITAESKGASVTGKNGAELLEADDFDQYLNNQTSRVTYGAYASRAVPDRFDSVTILNQSVRNLRILALDVMLSPFSVTPVVRADSIKETLKDKGRLSLDPTIVTITSNQGGDIYLDGTLNNPEGYTTIRAEHGSIVAGAANSIATQSLILEAQEGHIGQANVAINATLLGSPYLKAVAKDGININVAQNGVAETVKVDGLSSTQGDVTLAMGANNINLTGALSADGHAALITDVGFIADNHFGGNDITASTLRMTGTGNLGEAINPLEIAVQNLEVSTDQGLFANNAGDLTIGGISSDTDGLTTGAALVLNAGGIININENITVGDTLDMTALGQIAIDQNLHVIATANAKLFARDTSTSLTDSINLQDGVTLKSTQGDLTLLSGDDFIVKQGQQLIAGGVSGNNSGKLTIGIDQGNADGGVGASFGVRQAGGLHARQLTVPTLADDILKAGSLYIVGESDNDTIIIPDLFLKTTFEAGAGSDSIDVTISRDLSDNTQLRNINAESVHFQHDTTNLRAYNWLLDTSPLTQQMQLFSGGTLTVDSVKLSEGGNSIIENVHSNLNAFESMDVHYRFSAASDTLQILALQQPTLLEMSGGDDHVIVGGTRTLADNSTQIIHPGYVQQPLMLIAGAGNDTFELRDERTGKLDTPVGRLGSSDANTGLVSGYGSSRYAQGVSNQSIKFQTFEAVVVNLGGTDAIFTVDDTLLPTVINAGAGNDVINIRKLSAQTTVNLEGGDDTVNIQGGGELLTIDGGSQDKSLDLPDGGDRIILGSTRSFDSTVINVLDGLNAIKVAGSGWETGQQVLFTTDGVAPAGLVNNHLYYVVAFGRDIVRLAQTRVQALAANPTNPTDINIISLGNGGTGQHQLTLALNGQPQWPVMVGSLTGTDVNPLLSFNQPAAEVAVTANVVSNSLSAGAGHTFKNGQQVAVYATGDLPSGLHSDQFYYVVNVAANSFQLALSQNGAPVTLGIIGSGQLYTAPINTASFVNIEKMNVLMGLGNDTFVVNNSIKNLSVELRGGPGNDQFVMVNMDKDAETVIRGDSGANDSLRVIVTGNPQPGQFAGLQISAGIEGLTIDNTNNTQMPVDWIVSQGSLYFVDGAATISTSVSTTTQTEFKFSATAFNGTRLSTAALAVGDRVLFAATDNVALPTPLDASQFYTVRSVTETGFTVVNAVDGSALLLVAGVSTQLSFRRIAALASLEGAAQAQILGGLLTNGTAKDTLNVISPLSTTLDVTGNKLNIIDSSVVLSDAGSLARGSFVPGRIDGLQGVQSVVATQNNHFVFAAGTDENKLALFVRQVDPANASNSLLKWVGAIDSANGVPDKPTKLVLSADEKFLYAIGDVSIAVFKIGTVNGLPTLTLTQALDNAAVQNLTKSVNLSLTFSHPTDLVFNADGTEAYVTDTGAANGLGSDDGIVVLTRNNATGAFTSVKQKLTRENSFGTAVDVGNDVVARGPDASYGGATVTQTNWMDEPLTSDITGQGVYSFYVNQRSAGSRITPILLQATTETDHTDAASIQFRVVATGTTRMIEQLGLNSFEFGLQSGITSGNGLYFGWIVTGTDIAMSRGTSSNAYVKNDIAANGTVTNNFGDGYAYSMKATFAVEAVKGITDPTALALSSDGTRLFSGDSAGSIATWEKDAAGLFHLTTNTAFEQSTSTTSDNGRAVDLSFTDAHTLRTGVGASTGSAIVSMGDQLLQTQVSGTTATTVVVDASGTKSTLTVPQTTTGIKGVNATTNFDIDLDGTSVATNGNFIFVGAPGSDRDLLTTDTDGDNAGAVVILNASDHSVFQVIAPSTTKGDGSQGFGKAIAVDGNNALISMEKGGLNYVQLWQFTNNWFHKGTYQVDSDLIDLDGNTAIIAGLGLKASIWRIESGNNFIKVATLDSGTAGTAKAVTLSGNIATVIDNGSLSIYKEDQLGKWNLQQNLKTQATSPTVDITEVSAPGVYSSFHFNSFYLYTDGERPFEGDMEFEIWMGGTVEYDASNVHHQIGGTNIYGSPETNFALETTHNIGNVYGMPFMTGFFAKYLKIEAGKSVRFDFWDYDDESSNSLIPSWYSDYAGSLTVYGDGTSSFVGKDDFKVTIDYANTPHSSDINQETVPVDIADSLGRTIVVSKAVGQVVTVKELTRQTELFYDGSLAAITDLVLSPNNTAVYATSAAGKLYGLTGVGAPLDFDLGQANLTQVQSPRVQLKALTVLGNGADFSYNLETYEVYNDPDEPYIVLENPGTYDPIIFNAAFSSYTDGSPIDLSAVGILSGANSYTLDFRENSYSNSVNFGTLSIDFAQTLPGTQTVPGTYTCTLGGPSGYVTLTYEILPSPFVQTLTDGAEAKLAGASSVTLSADGLKVFVTAKDSDAITVFTRNPYTNELTKTSALTAPSVPGLDGASSSAQEALFSGKQFIVTAGSGASALTTYTLSSGVLTQDQRPNPNGVNGLGQDNPTGTVTRVQALVANPAVDGLFYMVSPEDNLMYVLSRDADGKTTVVQLLKDNVLGLFKTVDLDLAGAAALAVSPDGQFVYVAATHAENNGKISVYQRTTLGQIQGLKFVQSFDTSVFNVLNANPIVTLVVSPDGNNVYVSGSKGLEVFSRNSITGLLTSQQLINESIAALTFTATALVYAVTPATNTLMVYTRAANGTLTVVNSYVTQADPRSVQVSADGRFVYVASAGTNAITVYDQFLGSTDTTLDGNLHAVQHVREGVDGARGLQGVREVLLSAAIEDSVLTVNADQLAANGTIQTLTPHNLLTGQKLTVNAGGALNISVATNYFVRKIDATHFQLASTEDFARFGTDIISLSPANGTSAINLHTRIEAGAYLYALGYDANAISVFARDVDPLSSSFGQLTFMQVIRNRIGNATGGANDGLFQPNSIVAPRGGDYVFVGSGFDALTDQGVGGFVTLHNNAFNSPALPAANISLAFGNMKALNVITGAGDDNITVHTAANNGGVNQTTTAANAIALRIDTGDGFDSLTLNDVAANVTANLGDGKDTFTLRSSRDMTENPVTVKVDTGSKSDAIIIDSVGAKATVIVETNTSPGDDVQIDASGINPTSQVTIKVSLNDHVTVKGVNTLPADKKVIQLPGSSIDNLRLEDSVNQSAIDNNDIVLSDKVTARLAASTATLNEGGTLRLDASQSSVIPANAGEWVTVQYAWDLNGDGLFTEFVSDQSIIDLSWSDLLDFGFASGDVVGSITKVLPLRVTRIVESASTGVELSRAFSDAQLTVTVSDVLPTLSVVGATSAVMSLDGTPYRIALSATDPGNGQIDSWTVAWGDGSKDTYGSDALPAHFYQAPGRYTVSVTALDNKDNTVDANPIGVYAVFDQSSVSAGAPYTLKEGQGLTLAGRAAGTPDVGSYAWTVNGQLIGSGQQLEVSWNDLVSKGVSNDGQLPLV